MSTILKALKKLEHEKTTTAPEPLRLDADILKTTDSDSPRVSLSGKSLLLLLLVFGCGITTAYVCMKVPHQQSNVQKSEPAISATRSPILPAQPETPPNEIRVVPAQTNPVKKAQQIEQMLPAQPADATTATREKNNIVPTPSGLSEINQNKAEQPETATAPSVPVKPLLRVNGIAFQNTSADSMAIVNGTPVSSGSTIEGATVDEIRKDRVLFQRNGEKFEIHLGQSNP